MRRVNKSTAGWAIGGAILVVLLGFSFFYSGRGTAPSSGENPPNAATQSQPNK